MKISLFIVSFLLLSCFAVGAETDSIDETALAMMKADPITQTEAALAEIKTGSKDVLAVEIPAENKVTENKTAESHTETTAKSLKNLKESEIPVVLENAKKSSSESGPFMKILMSLSILGVIACAAYFFLKKYIAKGKTNNKATQIKVLTQHHLGPKKSIAIVRVAGESILVGITDHNISMLKSLSLLDEDIPEETPKNFEKLFNKIGKTGSASEEFIEPNGEDEFSISGIKDFVSTKLKNMRSIE